MFKVSASAAGVTCLDLGSNVNTSLDAFVEVYAFSNHTYQDGNFIENENVAPNITVDFTSKILIAHYISHNNIKTKPLRR